MADWGFIVGVWIFGILIGIVGGLFYTKRKLKKELKALESDTELHKQIKQEEQRQKEVENARRDRKYRAKQQERSEILSDSTVNRRVASPSQTTDTTESAVDSREEQRGSEEPTGESEGDELPGTNYPLRD